MASAKTTTKPPRGMRDFLPEDVRKREYVIGVIKEVYERYGFEPLETPAAELLETLMGKYGEEGNKLIFKILRRGVHEGSGESDLALRYDLTVPLARVYAQYHHIFPRFLKRYQIQPVWRADRPARGRFREFYQCDVDVVSSRSMLVEAELCTAAAEILTRLGFNNFTIRLNHRKVLTGLLLSTGIPVEKHTSALICLDKLDKVGRQHVESELVERGIESDSAKALLDFFDSVLSLEHAAEIAISDDVGSRREALNVAIIGRLVETLTDSEVGALGVHELLTILKYSSVTHVGDRIKIDPGLARGLSYYTGAIFEISVPYLTGSLGGGGRYDNLIGMFFNREVPACGFSLGLERILVIMNERAMFPSSLTTAPDVMVAIARDEFVVHALYLAQYLRAVLPNLRVLVYPQPNDKIDKQRQYRRTRRIPLLVTISETGQPWLESEPVLVEQIPELIIDMLPRAVASLQQEQRIADHSGRESE